MREALDFRAIAEAISTDWHSIGRPEQLPPPGAWFGWLYCAGRGAGKTRSASEWVRLMVESGQGRRIALVGATAADVRDTMVQGESGLLAVSPDWNRPTYEPSKRKLTWPNGAEALCFSSEEPERLRGPQFDCAWVDELCAFLEPQSTWDMLSFCLRLGTRPRVVVTTTPKPIKLLKELMNRPDFVVTRGKTADNAANLAPTFLKTVTERYSGTRLGRAELDGEVIEESEGALWTRAIIESTRILRADRPALTRVVVAIDPAVSVGENSDETGIVVAGLGENGHGYILEDISGRYGPTEWSSKAVAAYHRWGADRVVAEVNQGGDLVENTLRMVDPAVAYKGIHASRGKIVRAEPVSALYEQGRVHHVGAFPALEDQMASFEPGARKSPDRADAMVWCISELMVGASTSGVIDYYRQLAADPATFAPAEPRFGYAFTPPGRGRVVRFIVPEGHSTILLMSGVSLSPDASGIIACPESDAGALRIQGWAEVPAAIEGELLS